MTKTKKPTIKTELKPKEERFCWLYVCCKGSFGNATESYYDAYGYDEKFERFKSEESEKLAPLLAAEKDKKEQDKLKNKLNEIVGKKYDIYRNTSAVEGSKLLRKAKIDKRIREMLLEMFDDEMVDAELSKVIHQDEDLKSKVSAIKEYNNLKNRISKTPLVDTEGLNAITEMLREMGKK